MFNEENDDSTPIASGRTGGDTEGGGGSGGEGIGPTLPSGNAITPKRRGRPPSSLGLSGSNLAGNPGRAAAARSYLGAAGIRVGTTATTNRGSGGGDFQEDTASSGGQAGADLSGEAVRGQPQPVSFVPTGAKRGRPKKDVQGAVKEETVAHGVCAVFGAVAVLTKHKHWSKTTEKVAPISVPLTEWVNSMDPETVERLQKYLLPMSVLTGVVAVVTPDIMVEIELKKLMDAQRRGLPSTPPMAPPSRIVTPPVESQGDGAVAGNVNGQGSSPLPGPISVTAPPADL